MSTAIKTTTIAGPFSLALPPPSPLGFFPCIRSDPVLRSSPRSLAPDDPRELNPPLQLFQNGLATCLSASTLLLAPAPGSYQETPLYSSPRSLPAHLPASFVLRTLPFAASDKRRITSVLRSSITHSISSPFSNSNASAIGAGQIR